MNLKNYKLNIQRLMYEQGWSPEAISQVDEEEFEEYWEERFSEGVRPKKALREYAMDCSESEP